MTTFIPQLCQHTPSVGVLDNRGLAVRDIAYNHAAVADPIVELISRSEFSPAGYLTSSIDPRLFTAHQTDASVTPNFRYQHDLAGSALRTDSVDAGWQVALVDAEGRPVWHSDARGTLRRYEYEASTLPGRPLALYEQPAGEAEQVAERFVYAGNAAADKQFNLAGQVLHHYDTAGVTRLTSQALSGAALSQERQLLANTELPPNWSGSDENVWKKALSATIFITQSTADSTGAPLTQTDAKGNQQRFAYNRAGQRVASWLTLKGKTEQPVIKALSYSAAGQKLREEHGNGCATDYTYEPQTQRLLGCKTSRASGVLQDLRYDYDPVGNILSIYNDAEATRFYRNQKIDPENTYAYDALYQLISATGYESSANQPQAAQNSNWQTPIPTDRTQYVNYTRSYRYDNASNLLQLSHTGAASYTHNISLSDRANHGVFNPQNTALTRQQIEARYDAAGNQLDLNNGTLLSWNPRNLLAQATVVTRDSQTFDGETYLYDGGSMRVQKCTRSQAGTVAHLHTVTYLPGLELHSKTQNGVEKEGWQVVTAGAAGHAQVRALCWTVGKPAGLTDGQLRFSIDNLIGSSLLELDADGQIISQEAYFPFGGTAVSATRDQVEADYKTLRYSGKERDATGLYYYGYRYYQPWAGRWLSADPAGTIDGLNLYRMVRNNPVTLMDPDGRDTLEWLDLANTNESKNIPAAIYKLNNIAGPHTGVHDAHMTFTKKTGDIFTESDNNDNKLNKYKKEKDRVKIMKGMRYTKAKLRDLAAHSGFKNKKVYKDEFANITGNLTIKKTFPGVELIGEKIKPELEEFHPRNLKKTERWNFSFHLGYYRIVDTEAYISGIKEKYETLKTKLHPVVERRIRDHISRNKNILPKNAGIAGLHAEVQALNHILSEPTLGEGVSQKLSNSYIFTQRLVGAKNEDFPACHNCSGILSGLENVMAGKTNDIRLERRHSFRL